MKKILSIIFVLILSANFVYAELPRFVDNAGLLTDAEGEALLSMLDEISERHECDVIIITERSFGGKGAAAYADDYYDYNGYGYGENDDGILFALSIGERDWAISTYGLGIDAFTDARQKSIIDKIKPMLSNNNFNSAFVSFATQCNNILEQPEGSEQYNENDNSLGDAPASKTNQAKTFFICLLIGIIIAFISVSTMKGKLKSVKMQVKADNYVRSGSMKLRSQNEMFLYKNVVRTPRQTSSGSSGGGSSVHRSSSGRSHGGSSGKF